MWSSWFPNGIFPTRRSRNSNLQQRILSLIDSSKHEAVKNESPILKELKTHKNKVSRMSSVYEGNISNFNENNSSNVTRKLSNMSAIIVAPKDETENLITLERPKFQQLNDVNKLKNCIKSIVNIEKDYLKEMKLMIEHYVDECDHVPALVLKGELKVTNRQKEEIFGPLGRMYEVHKNLIYPKISACVDDVALFGLTISSLCNDGVFNVYIVYAMDEKNCEHRRKSFYKFFVGELKRKSGVTFNFSPIQHLAQIHLIIIEMLRELQNHEVSQNVIDSMTRAGEDWKVLMNKVYMMRNL